MPNLFMLRPGDGNEVSGAYHVALSRRTGPTLLALSRQKLDAQLEGSSIEKTLKGGYVLTDNAAGGKLDLILLGTGAETVLCQQAAAKLREEGMKCDSTLPTHSHLCMPRIGPEVMKSWGLGF